MPGTFTVPGRNPFREKFPEILAPSEIADLCSKRRHPYILCAETERLSMPISKTWIAVYQTFAHNLYEIKHYIFKSAPISVMF